MFEKIKKIIAKHQAIEKNNSLNIANHNLLLAARQGNYSDVVEALASGADINHSSNNTNVLFSAISSGDVKCLKLILDSNVNLNFKADAGLSAFQFAIATHANVDVLNCLLDYPFDHNIQDVDGNTNVHYASTELELLKKIVSKGGRLDIRNKEGRNPFNYQFLSPNLENRKDLCEFYVNQKCDIFEKNNNEQSTFLLGVMCGKVHKQKAVIDYFCSLINTAQYFAKASEQIEDLKQSENKEYVVNALNAISVSSTLEKELVIKPGKDKKLKI
jgi:ankyrin repeat protein